jgi:hypothetical protein
MEEPKVIQNITQAVGSSLVNPPITPIIIAAQAPLITILNIRQLYHGGQPKKNLTKMKEALGQLINNKEL